MADQEPQKAGEGVRRKCLQCGDSIWAMEEWLHACDANGGRVGYVHSGRCARLWEVKIAEGKDA